MLYQHDPRITLSGLARCLGCFHDRSFGFGISFYGATVFLETLHTTKDWPIAAISTAITVHFLVGAAIVTYLPEIHRAIGIANATILSALLSAIGILGWSNVAYRGNFSW